MKILNLLKIFQKVLTENSDRERSPPFFSVANSKQEFWALLITKGGVRGDVGSEKHGKNLLAFIWRKAVISNIFIAI
jgi:hypothetical protein